MFRKVRPFIGMLVLMVVLLVCLADRTDAYGGKTNRAGNNVTEASRKEEQLRQKQAEEKRGKNDETRKWVLDFNSECDHINSELNKLNKPDRSVGRQTGIEQAWEKLSRVGSEHGLRSARNRIIEVLGTKIKPAVSLLFLNSLVNCEKNKFDDVGELREHYKKDVCKQIFDDDKLSGGDRKVLLSGVNAFLQNLGSKKTLLSESSSLIKMIEGVLSTSEKNLIELVDRVYTEQHSEDLKVVFDKIENRKNEIREVLESDPCSADRDELQILCSLSTSLAKHVNTKKKSKI